MIKPEFPTRKEPDINKIYEWLEEYLKDWDKQTEASAKYDDSNRIDLFLDILAQFYVDPYKYINYYDI